MKNKILTLDQYRRLQERTHDHARALQRTNLALRCLLRRMEDSVFSQREFLAEHQWAILTLFWNHLVQSHYRRNGIDIIPAGACDHFPYYASVRCITGVNQSKQISIVTVGSTRIDAPWIPTAENLEDMVTVMNHVLNASDPLFGLDNAVADAVGKRFLSKSTNKGRHLVDHEIYLTIYQIVTVLVCMGVVNRAVCGVEVDVHPYGVIETPTHPLRCSGMIPDPRFTEDWFDLDGRVFIHRSSGTLLIGATNRLIPFDIWCSGYPDQGIAYIFENFL